MGNGLTLVACWLTFACFSFRPSTLKTVTTVYKACVKVVFQFFVLNILQVSVFRVIKQLRPILTKHPLRLPSFEFVKDSLKTQLTCGSSKSHFEQSTFLPLSLNTLHSWSLIFKSLWVRVKRLFSYEKWRKLVTNPSGTRSPTHLCTEALAHLLPHIGHPQEGHLSSYDHHEGQFLI